MSQYEHNNTELINDQQEESNATSYGNDVFRNAEQASYKALQVSKEKTNTCEVAQSSFTEK